MRSGIEAGEVGVLVNDRDPQSVAVAANYISVRQIPAQNVVHLSFPVVTALTAAQFQPLKTLVDASLAANVQALAITWTQPYAVEGESVTSAFALGFDAKWYASILTARSPYYDTDTTTPFTDLGIRPAMALAGSTTQKVLDLIARGKSADGTHPTGTVYFVNTTDQLRSLRYGSEMVPTASIWNNAGTGITLALADNSTNQLGTNDILNRTRVFGIFTGVTGENGINTNTYLPGAVADHLTSYGGMYPSGQMSSVNWLDNGLTASSGTVQEPYAIAEKFSNPAVLMPRYFSGNTVVEAYFKSIQWPGESILIGDPLARPWENNVSTTYENGTFTIRTSWMLPNHIYQVLVGDSPTGPFSVAKDNLYVTAPTWSTIVISGAVENTYYKLAIKH